MPSTTFQEWDFRGKRLERSMEPADFISSDSTLILATPIANFTGPAITAARAVGIAQDMSLSQNRQVIQVFEIGSNQKYTLSSGRTTGQIAISRLLFDGDSLLTVLAPLDITVGSDPHDKAGHGSVSLNLASSMFARSMGIILVFRDLESQNIAATFFEETFVVSHNMNISSNSPFIGENVSLLYNAQYPLEIGTLGVNQGGTADGQRP